MRPGGPAGHGDRVAGKEYSQGWRVPGARSARHGEDGAGFIVGLFAFQELLEVFLKNIAPGYAVALYDDGEEVYRRGAAGGQDEANGVKRRLSIPMVLPGGRGSGPCRRSWQGQVGAPRGDVRCQD